MAKFNFRLEPILNLKKQLEDNQKNELGKAITKLESEKYILNSIDEKLSDSIKKVNQVLCSPVLVHHIKTHNNYIKYLNDEFDRQKEVVKEESRNVDIQREKLLEIVKERKVFEKLRERLFTEFIKEQEVKEQKLVDEIICYKKSEGSNGKKREY